ncbi:MAG: S26 family signal peptidase [Planctomycetaceae bacterium]|nr:S26 family signal peptidase [Planctomycetaceae bacterium]
MTWRTRLIAEWTVWAFIVAVLIETWLVEGLLVPCQVVGGSMAPGLVGTHRAVVCGDCGFRFACGTDRHYFPATAVCPNCGYASNDIGPLADVSGDRVLISPEAFAFRRPRRWEVVALRRPSASDQIVLKRVVGLPGERVEIRDGDVYVDGAVARKGLAEQRAVAIPVYDAMGDRVLRPPRWRSEPSGRWKLIEGQYVHAVGHQGDPIDWLVYHHGRRTNAGITLQRSSAPESPVMDLDGYDQTQPRREEDVHAVADLMLSLRLCCSGGNGTFYVRATDGTKRFEVRIQFGAASPRYEAFCDGQLLPQAVGAMSVGMQDERQIEVAVVDQQFVLAFDGKMVVRWPYERAGRPALTTTPVAIGVQGLEATVRDLRLYRDAYYGQPIGRRTGAVAGAVQLGSDEYYVLGDNSPISEDSRHWPCGGAIPGSLLVGKPLAAIPSVEISPWAAWHFQVPNPGQIRYIP